MIIKNIVHLSKSTWSTLIFWQNLWICNNIACYIFSCKSWSLWSSTIGPCVINLGTRSIGSRHYWICDIDLLSSSSNERWSIPIILQVISSFGSWVGDSWIVFFCSRPRLRLRFTLQSQSNKIIRVWWEIISINCFLGKLLSILKPWTLFLSRLLLLPLLVGNLLVSLLLNLGIVFIDLRELFIIFACHCLIELIQIFTLWIIKSLGEREFSNFGLWVWFLESNW